MVFPVDVVVMAAGKGTRMKSQRPKVLHRLGGRALAQHVIDTAGRLSARSVVVITGHGAEQVEAGLHAPAATDGHGATQLKYVRQEPQLGTGHAVQQAAPALPDGGVTLVLSGDVPLTQPDTLQALLDANRRFGTTLLIVTHNADIARIADRVIHFADGSIRSITVNPERLDPAQLHW